MFFNSFFEFSNLMFEICFLFNEFVAFYLGVHTVDGINSASKTLWIHRVFGHNDRKPYEFIGFSSIRKPYEFIWFLIIIRKSYEFIWFLNIGKPYEFTCFLLAEFISSTVWHVRIYEFLLKLAWIIGRKATILCMSCDAGIGGASWWRFKEDRPKGSCAPCAKTFVMTW